MLKNPAIAVKAVDRRPQGRRVNSEGLRRLLDVFERHPLAAIIVLQFVIEQRALPLPRRRGEDSHAGHRLRLGQIASRPSAGNFSTLLIQGWALGFCDQYQFSSSPLWILSMVLSILASTGCSGLPDDEAVTPSACAKFGPQAVGTTSIDCPVASSTYTGNSGTGTMALPSLTGSSLTTPNADTNLSLSPARDFQRHFAIGAARTHECRHLLVRPCEQAADIELVPLGPKS